MALAPEALAEIRGATVLPNDCVVNRFAGLAIPYDRSFTLVGDADSSHLARLVLRPYLRACERHRNLRRRDLLRIVLDPPEPRKDLIEFTLRHRTDRPFLIE